MKLKYVKFLRSKNKKSIIRNSKTKAIYKKKKKSIPKKKLKKNLITKTKSFIFDNVLSKNDFDPCYIHFLLKKSSTKNLLNKLALIPKQWKKFYNKFFGHLISNKVLQPDCLTNPFYVKDFFISYYSFISYCIYSALIYYFFHGLALHRLKVFKSCLSKLKNFYNHLIISYSLLNLLIYILKSIRVAILMEIQSLIVSKMSEIFLKTCILLLAKIVHRLYLRKQRDLVSLNEINFICKFDSY
mmetsp:Transcript_26655/g.47233  ORF Transcript_26655/g.47233 Transcript_26655/m.47233 type:complete len:242 (-) Transcript_26655:1654-2379(-)